MIIGPANIAISTLPAIPKPKLNPANLRPAPGGNGSSFTFGFCAQKCRKVTCNTALHSTELLILFNCVNTLAPFFQRCIGRNMKVISQKNFRFEIKPLFLGIQDRRMKPKSCPKIGAVFVLRERRNELIKRFQCLIWRLPQ